MEILTSKDLLKQQLEDIAEKKPSKNVKPVDVSKSTGIQYNVQMQKMIKSIKQDIDRKLLPVLRKLAPQYQTDSVFTMDTWVDEITAVLTQLTTKWTSPEFNAIADFMANQFVREADGVNGKRFNRSMRSFGMDVFGDSPALQDYLSASAYDNAQLIKSIPQQYLAQVESITMTNVRAGGRPSSIAKSLQQQFGVTKKRARFIARDQTAKINGDLSAKRQQAVGFDYFRWVDVNDERVRHRHDQISEKVTAYGKGVYRWDNPPLSDKGIPIIPGQDFNCRCIAVPVSNAQVEQNQKDGNTNPSVKR